MAWIIYDSMILLQHNSAGIDFNTDDINCMITTSTYTPAKATHDFKADVTNEVSGSGYVAGGKALASKTVALSTAVVTFDAADLTWSQDGSGFGNGKYAVLYQSTSSASGTASILIAYADIGSSKGNVAGDLTLEMSAAGIFTATN
jgi:hypothetical protein